LVDVHAIQFNGNFYLVNWNLRHGQIALAPGHALPGWQGPSRWKGGERPVAFIGLLEGRNFGKLVMRVAEA
jgi:hypothetical protein